MKNHELEIRVVTCSKRTAENKPQQPIYLVQTSLTPKYKVEFKELFWMYCRVKRNEKPRTAFWIDTNTKELASIQKYAFVPLWLKNDKL